MKTKILLFSSALASVLPLTAAQIAGGEGGIFTSFTDLLRTIIGVETLSPSNMFYFAIGLGIIWVTLTIVLEKGLEKLGMEDVFTGTGMGNEGSKKMLYVLSLLLTLMMVGTGAVTGLVAGLQSFFMLAIASILLALLITALFGLPSGALFGLGGGMKALGKASDFSGIDSGTAKKAGKSVGKGLEKAKNFIQEAEQDMNEVEKEEQEAAQQGNFEEAKHAAREEEEAEGDMEKAGGEIERVLSAEMDEISETLQEARDAVRIENEEEGMLEGKESMYRQIDRLLRSWSQGLQTAYSEKGGCNWDAFMGGKYNAGGESTTPKNFDDRLRSAVKEMKELQQMESEEEELVKEELAELRQETKALMDAVNLSREIEADLQEMEKEEEYLEKFAEKVNERKLAREVSTEEEELRKLVQELQQIKKEEEDVRKKLQNVEKFLNKELKIEQNAARDLAKVVEEDEEIEEELEQLRNVINTDNGIFSPDKTQKANQMLERWEGEIEEIEQIAQRLRQRKKNEAEEMSNLGSHVKNHLNQHFS